MQTILVLFFITIIAGGLVWAYFNYLGAKGEKLKLINQGICPECKEQTMEVINQKGGGCSGTSFVEFKCSNCKYEDSFNLGGGSCKR
jgi:phage FluMu protein Com